jgi:hypothetical protein
MNTNNVDSLNIQKCCELLEINLDYELTKLNHEYIKKKYHKMALKWHPDKNKNIDQKLVNDKFQKINEAYEFLCKELDYINNTNSNTNTNTFVSSEPTIYINLLTIFVSNIIKGNYKDIIIPIIKEIVFSSKEYIYLFLKHKFECLNKETILELYRLLYKYKDILYINNDILEFVSCQIKEKYEKNQIYILKPSINDIINNNIYKLYVDDKLLLVPLWHNELYFDNPNDSENEIIVLCQPNLPENIVIDDNNNINYELKLDFINDLLEKSELVFTIGNKIFKIPIGDLHIKKEQYYILKNQGISKIIENDMYNVDLRNDIIIKIIFM